jgi:hypothetical protein
MHEELRRGVWGRPMYEPYMHHICTIYAPGVEKRGVRQAHICTIYAP